MGLGGEGGGVGVGRLRMVVWSLGGVELGGLGWWFGVLGFRGCRVVVFQHGGLGGWGLVV